MGYSVLEKSLVPRDAITAECICAAVLPRGISSGSTRLQTHTGVQLTLRGRRVRQRDGFRHRRTEETVERVHVVTFYGHPEIRSRYSSRKSEVTQIESRSTLVSCAGRENESYSSLLLPLENRRQR